MCSFGRCSCRGILQGEGVPEVYGWVFCQYPRVHRRKHISSSLCACLLFPFPPPSDCGLFSERAGGSSSCSTQQGRPSTHHTDPPRSLPERLCWPNSTATATLLALQTSVRSSPPTSGYTDG